MSYFDELIDLNNLYASYKKSKKGSDWKPQVQRYEEHWLTSIVKTKDLLTTHTYIPRKGSEFVIHERGKIRKIRANPFFDRVIRRCLCDYVLEPCLYPYLVHDNGASIKGKGISFTRRRFEQQIHEFYRKNHSNEGYILIIDFKKYYDSIPHKELMEEVCKHLDDPDVLWLLTVILKNFEIDGKPISCGIGDQCSQVFGVYYPTYLDTYFKVVEACKYFERYQDDTVIIHNSKEFLHELLNKASIVANKLGLVFNKKKTHIYKLSRGFSFLQIRYRLSKSGHLCKRMNPKRVSSQRRRIRKYYKLYSNGKMTYKDIEDSFKSWINSYKKLLSKKTLQGFYKLFDDLFINPFILCYGGVYDQSA